MTENYKEKNFTLSYGPMMIEHFSIKNVFIYHRENNEFPVKILEIHENEILVNGVLEKLPNYKEYEVMQTDKLFFQIQDVIFTIENLEEDLVKIFR